MPDRDGNRSNPYHPKPDGCCEACIFGRGKHAEWCEAVVVLVEDDGTRHIFPDFDDPGVNRMLCDRSCLFTPGTRKRLDKEIAALYEARVLSPCPTAGDIQA